MAFACEQEDQCLGCLEGHWSRGITAASLSVPINGAMVTAPVENGYAAVPSVWETSDRIGLHFDLPAR